MTEIPAEQVVHFVMDRLVFHVVLSEEGELIVTSCGRGTSRMAVIPRSNASVSCVTVETIAAEVTADNERKEGARQRRLSQSAAPAASASASAAKAPGGS